MYSEPIIESMVFHLRNTALSSFNADSYYKDIISPFTRIYLITEGNGWLLIENHKIPLEAGNLYLIPSFTTCSYHFEAGLSHYYIHLSIDQPNGLSPYSLYSVMNEKRANDLDFQLLQRLVQLNPDIQLPHHHPNVYQTNLWINKKVDYHSICQHLETIGILKQLFSRFLVSGQAQTITSLLKYNMHTVLIFIQNNLQYDIRINDLAGMACLSKDHFSKVFKSIAGLAPCDYIIRKRIERAQFLLLTTELNQIEISEQIGFKSASYFSRMFKKITLHTPEKYRQQEHNYSFVSYFKKAMSNELL